MRPNPPLIVGLIALTLPLVVAACGGSSRGKQSFGPGSTGATNSSGTNPGGGTGNPNSNTGGTPTVGSFAATGDLNEERYRHTATLLLDGRVLVVGGVGSPPARPIRATAEVWTPSTGTWQRTDAIATAPASGFLLIGGLANQQSTRLDHAAILIPNATAPQTSPVLIVGGFGQERFTAGAPTGESLRSVFLFDPTTNGFTQKASMSANRRAPAIGLTDAQSNNVLVTGGIDNTAGQGTGGNTIQSSERYDLTTDTWTALPNGNTAGAHGYGLGFFVNNQTIVINGASIQQSAGQTLGWAIGPGATPRSELFNATAGTWAATNPQMGDRFFFAGSLDTSSGTRVFVCGGFDPNQTNFPALASVEIFDKTSGNWTQGPALSQTRALHAVSEIGGGVASGTGDMLISGGRTVPGSMTPVQTAQCDVYGVLTNSLIGTVNMAQAREDHRSTRLSDGRVLITGGFVSTGNGMALKSCEVYTR